MAHGCLGISLALQALPCRWCRVLTRHRSGRWLPRAGGSSYAGLVVGGQDDDTARRERAALVALLRERPGRRGWTELTASVLEAGSALVVWQRLVPPVLMSPPGESGPAGKLSEPGAAAGSRRRPRRCLPCVPETPEAVSAGELRK